MVISVRLSKKQALDILSFINKKKSLILHAQGIANRRFTIKLCESIMTFQHE